MLKLVAVLSLLASTVGMAARLPVDEAIDGLRAKANHLEMLKTLLTEHSCTVDMGNNQIVINAAALRDNGAVLAVTDSIPGSYLAFSQAPKAHMLKQVVAMTHKKNVNRVFIISSSLTAKPGATEYTHLLVKVAEPLLQKDIQDPATGKGTLVYEQYPIVIALEKVRGGHTTKEVVLKNGGAFSVTCK